MSRHYRPPAGQLMAALIVSAVFILIGLSTLTGPLQPGDVVVAVLLCALGCVGSALRLTTDVEVTRDDISYRLNFRRRAIPWVSVESFRVGRAAGFGSWSCVVVDVSQRGYVRIPIAGRRLYVERVLGELEEYRQAMTTAIN
jgi:hypothetical protein